MAAVRLTTTVLAGGRIDVVAPGLEEGTEVTVMVKATHPGADRLADLSPPFGGSVRGLIGQAGLAGRLDLDNESIDRDLGAALLAELDGHDPCS